MVQVEKTRAVNLAWNVPGAVYMGRAGRGEDGYFGNRFAKNVPGSLELFEVDFVARVAKGRRLPAARLRALVFQGGQRFTLGRLRDHKTWPSACFQCARPISDANWPVDMWTGLDSRHCFAGCFECWKDVMRCRSFCLESYEGPH
jgi:hypothetical protein